MVFIEKKDTVMGFVWQSIISPLLACSNPNSLNSNPHQSHEFPQGIIGRRFSFAEISIATRNFDSELLIGQSDYGKVFNGRLNGGVTVAVRRLPPKSNAIQRFKKEVILLLQIRHPNLVTFLGLCDEKKDNIIVYEYMVNGSLENHLYGSLHGRLSWEKRLRICIGVARGVHYLHIGSKRLIIHGDLKPNNILLDENLTPKLSEFGLSKIGPISMSRTNLKMQESRIMGTYGYMPHEYLFDGVKTEKVDVYSFGIVMLQVLVAKPIFEIFMIMLEAIDYQNIDRNNRAMTIYRELSRSHLHSFISASIEKGTIREIVDPSMRGEIAPSSLQMFLKLMQECLAYEAVERPSMGEVEVGLQLALQLQERP